MLDPRCRGTWWWRCGCADGSSGFIRGPHLPGGSRPVIHTLAPHLQEKLEKNGPFAEYANVKGLEVVWGDATDSSFLESLKPYDVVVENNGKDLDTCKPLIDAFKVMRHGIWLAVRGLPDSLGKVVVTMPDAPPPMPCRDMAGLPLHASMSP